MCGNSLVTVTHQEVQDTSATVQLMYLYLNFLICILNWREDAARYLDAFARRWSLCGNLAVPI